MQHKDDETITSLIALKTETINMLRQALKAYAENPGQLDATLVKEIRETVDSWMGDGDNSPQLGTQLVEARRSQPPFQRKTTASTP